MKVIKSILLTLAIVYMASAAVRGHPIYASEGTGALFVKSYYDGGTPAAFADVIIYGPDGEEFITGMTDKNGVFAFLPDTAGDWKTVIDDGMGHRIIKNIVVNEALKIDINDKSKYTPGFFGIVTGVSLIFGLWGLFALTMGKKDK